MWVGFLLGLVGTFAATPCPCSFTVDPLANSAVTSYVYPVIECDQICGPPALAYQYYSFEEPQGPCRCFAGANDLINYYYENASSTTNIYYQNGGSISICDPCFPSSSPTPSMSPSVSPSGMCYVVNNLLYGKVYTDGYYTVVHGINASHAYNPAPLLLGKNPVCTESPGVCSCSYTQGSSVSCPYTRSATLQYQYGATTTMTFVSESPVCRYTFNMFINFNSVSPTPSTSSSFTPAGSPTVSKTQSVSVSPSVTSSQSSSQSETPSISVTVSFTPSKSGEAMVAPLVKRNTPASAVEVVTAPSPAKSPNAIVGIVLGTLALAGMIGIAVWQIVKARHTTSTAPTQNTDDDDESDDEFVETPVTQYKSSHEFYEDNQDDTRPVGKTLLLLDTEDVGAIMMFLNTRMKTASIVDSYL